MRNRRSCFVGGLALCSLFSVAALAQEPIDSAEELVTKLQLLNQEEIRLGKLAMERASSPQVRAYGQHLMAEHQKSQEKVKLFAMEKQIEWNESMDLPPDRKEVVEKLAALAGEEFDSSFLLEMEAGHQVAMTTIRGATESLTETEAQELASDTLPMLEDHLERAKKLQKRPTE